MSIQLLVTSGRGPAECRMAVRIVVEAIREQADAVECDIDVTEGPAHKEGHGPASVVVTLEGLDDEQIARQWAGTVQWIAKGILRENHGRKNWFVSVSRLDRAPPVVEIRDDDLKIDTLRASGPGGQHVNKTESAVRITHKPTGIAVVARQERSQQMNRKLAMTRLRQLLEIQADMAKGEIQKEAQKRHDSLERGNPIRVLRA